MPIADMTLRDILANVQEDEAKADWGASNIELRRQYYVLETT